MRLAVITAIVAIAIPTMVLADSSQPNSSSGLQGNPATPQGEGTSGMNKQTPATSGSGVMKNGSATDAGKTGRAGTPGASDSSIPGATNPNEPRR